MEWSFRMKSMTGLMGIALFAMFLLGCREGDPPAADAKQAAPATAAGEGLDRQSVEREVGRSGGSGGPGKMSDDPAEAVAELRDQWASGRFEEIIKTLTKAEQERGSTTPGPSGWVKNDRATRAAFLDAVRRCATVIREKEPLIRGSERLLFDGPWGPLWEGHLVEIAEWSQGVAGWSGWLNEEAFGFPGLVETTSRELARQPELAGAIKAIEFATVSREGDRALIRFRLAEAEQAGEFVAVRSGGAWLPQWLLGSPGQPAEVAREGGEAEIVALTRRLEAVADMLAGVATVAEFDALVGQLADTLLSDEPRTAKPRRSVAETEMVWLIVSGELTEAEKDQLLWNVASRVDEPASAVAHLQQADSPDVVRIRVGPVGDLEGFARRLTGLQVERIEAERRTIQLKVAEDRSP